MPFGMYEHMKRKVICMLLIGIFSIFSIISFAAAGEETSDQYVLLSKKEEKKKTISVILDDSSSMIREDTLRLYIMGDFRNGNVGGAAGRTIEGGKQEKQDRKSGNVYRQYGLFRIDIF